MYDHLTNPDAGKERLQQFINEAEAYRRTSHLEAATGENAIITFIRSWIAKAQPALSNSANTRNTKTSDQPVKNSL